MTNFVQLWQGMQPRSRIGLLAGVVAILVAMGALGVWSMRTDYKVLFADLAPQDAATMVAELDRMKVGYQLDDGGNTILVPAELVHKTRLKLVGRDLPLHGTVGLELFNNSEIGMTEFAQKVNYQRAQQGELTRTILSVEEIQSARVHLAIPEQGLFKKSGSQSKASITVTLKPGKTLRAEQVKGIQRLVAAAMPNIKPEDVTLLDQHGVALTAYAGDGEMLTAADSLDSKRNAEQYLSRKVNQMLDQTFGPGVGFASVDVILKHDHSKTTTERVLPASETAEVQTGVVVREKQSSRDNANSDGTKTADSAGPLNSEVDYQVGRRVEQTVSAAGAINRLNVAVVVKWALDAQQVERIKDVVAVAVGFNKARGDAIAVYPMAQLVSQEVLPTPVAAPAAEAPVRAAAVPVPARADAHADAVVWSLLGLLGLVAGAALWRARGRRRQPALARLSDEQREQLLRQVQHWADAKAAGQRA